MSRRKYSRYTPEQRAQAVRIVRESGKSIGEVAEELDIARGTLGVWVHQLDGGAPKPAPLSSDERAELQRLRRRTMILEQERDFLKKAAV
jgi:transposase